MLTNEKCTEKADIFSFGVLLLRTMTSAAHCCCTTESRPIVRCTLHLTGHAVWLGIVLWEIVTGEQPVRGGRRDARWVLHPCLLARYCRANWRLGSQSALHLALVHAM